MFKYSADQRVASRDQRSNSSFFIDGSLDTGLLVNDIVSIFERGGVVAESFVVHADGELIFCESGYACVI